MSTKNFLDSKDIMHRDSRGRTEYLPMINHGAYDCVQTIAQIVKGTQEHVKFINPSHNGQFTLVYKASFNGMCIIKKVTQKKGSNEGSPTAA